MRSPAVPCLFSLVIAGPVGVCHTGPGVWSPNFGFRGEGLSPQCFFFPSLDGREPTAVPVLMAVPGGQRRVVPLSPNAFFSLPIEHMYVARVACLEGRCIVCSLISRTLLNRES